MVKIMEAKPDESTSISETMPNTPIPNTLQIEKILKIEENSNNLSNLSVFEEQTIQKIPEFPKRTPNVWVLNKQAVKRVKPEELKLSKDALSEFNSKIRLVIEKSFIYALNETKSRNKIIATIHDIKEGMKLALEEEVQLELLEFNKNLAINLFEERKKAIQERKNVWITQGDESNGCNGRIHTENNENTK